ncbi:MAG: serine hydrolase, partial [Roseiflexaceae bacterium]
MPRIIKVIIVTSIALLVLIATCSPLQRPRTVIAPASALQAAYSAQPTAAPTTRPPADPPTAPAVATPVPLAASATSAPLVALVVPENASAAVAQPSATPAPLATQPAGQLARTIDSYLNDLVGVGWFQGTVLVARDGEVLLDKGYGLADAAQRLPNTPQTRFRLASLTKQFTAMAIMILQTRGQLNVQDSICSYLDNCPDAWRPISIRHLLTHTSGLPNYTDLADYPTTQMQPTTPDQLVARFHDLPLLFPPGTQYLYENSDYVLLGLIVERASGQRYGDFLREAIFAPLEMHDTGVDQNNGAVAGQALGYTQVGVPALALDTSTLFGAGSLYSTVEDLYRWDQALYTTKLLPQPQLDAMWMPYLREYGYGWRIGHLNGHRKISHPGLINGFANAIVRLPDDRVTVIVLGNLDSA